MFRLPQPAAPVPGKGDPAPQHEDELRPDREEDGLISYLCKVFSNASTLYVQSQLVSSDR